MSEILLEAKGISKHFGPTVALDGVELQIMRGKVHGLIGENGSGKSTLASVFAGILSADHGTMLFKDKPWKPSKMLEAQKKGVGMIVQEAGTVPGISIAQNVFLGSEGRFCTGPFVSEKKLNEAAQKVLENIGFSGVDVSLPIDTLDMQDRKLIEIAKVMWDAPEILIVDETTTALSQRGRSIIYEICAKQREQGKSVIFISHDLDECMEQCDCLTVLRDGKKTAHIEKADFSPALIKRHMVGREMGSHYYREDFTPSYSDEVVIDVANLTTGHGLLENVSLQLHKGELLGIGGLSHCGMHELGKAVFGAEKLLTGSVTHIPTKTKINNPRAAIRCGMGYVSKNRDSEALVLNSSIRSNIAMAALDINFKNGFLSPLREKEYVRKQIDALSIKCANDTQDVKQLSGGNKQKVVFAKWIGRNSDILILDCPTRGVDIGVKAAMYRLIEEAKVRSASVMIISEELTELIGMCDRLLILKDGHIKSEFMRSEQLSEADIIECMI